MQTHDAILAAHPFFAELRSQAMPFITACASSIHADVGTYIVHEGEEASHFYILNEGKVLLEAFDARLGAVPIETIPAGEVLGWSWLFPPYRWHFSARAIEPVHAVTLDALCLRDACERDHEFGYLLVKQVAQVMMQRLQATRLQLLDIYHVSEQGR